MSLDAVMAGGALWVAMPIALIAGLLSFYPDRAEISVDGVVLTS